MKRIIFLLFIFSLNSFSQTKYVTKTGMVNFKASVPSFEEVKAANNSVTAIINANTGEFAALVFVKGFRFKNALMEEHFNENYADSDEYPKATFKGKIVDFRMNVLQAESKLFKITGELTFHGETKPFENLEVRISKTSETINMEGEFKTYPSDFNIKIPKIVRNKIAEDVIVTYNFKMTEK